jgi:hypothetical protein
MFPGNEAMNTVMWFFICRLTGNLSDAAAIATNIDSYSDRARGGDRGVTSDERVQCMMGNFRILVHAYSC